MKYILTFESYSESPVSKGATVEMENENGGTLMDKPIEKDITPEQKEALEETEKEISKRIKVKKK